MFVSFNSNVTRVSLVEQELITLQEHLSYPPVFSGVRVVRSLVFSMMFCRSFFVLVLLTTVLSVLLRFTDSDYPFNIWLHQAILIKKRYDCKLL